MESENRSRYLASPYIWADDRLPASKFVLDLDRGNRRTDVEVVPGGDDTAKFPKTKEVNDE